MITNRRMHPITSLALIAALSNSVLADATAATAELRIDASPSTGLRLDNVTGQLRTAQAALVATGPLAQAAATSKPSRADPASETSEEQQRQPFPWRIVPPDTPDYAGAARDTAYFMVYQLAVIGLLYVAPESVSNWTEEDKETWNLDKWQENISNPERDTDDFIINYVLHPYWGATYYIRGRERGLNRPQSFAFSFGLSFLFEYGFEAFFENPSYQDLWVTPVIGSLVGEFWFSPVRDRIKAKPGELNWKDKTILFLTDPLGVLGSATDRALGIDTKVTVKAINTAAEPPVAGYSTRARSMSTARLSTRNKPALGLNVRFSW